MYERRTARGSLLKGIGNIVYTLIGSILGSLLIFALITNGVLKVPAVDSTVGTVQTLSQAASQKVQAGLTGEPVVEIAEKVGPAVVGIVNKVTPDNHPYGAVGGGTGSGVVFDSNGFIVTNNHVVDGASKLEVVLSDGRRLPAKLVGTDARTDLAVIKVEAEKLTAASFGNSDATKVGEPAVAIGNPLGQDYYGSVTSGIISANRRTVSVEGKEYIDLLQTDAAINPGNSGGALINIRGEVIGINSVKIGGQQVEGMGFAIPSNTVQRVVKDLVDKGKVTRPWLGVVYQGDVQQLPNIPEGVRYGVVINVSDNGPAQKAGMRNGDVIVAAGSEKIDSFASLQRMVFNTKIGDKLDITVFRNGKQEKIAVKLEEKPSGQQ